MMFGGAISTLPVERHFVVDPAGADGAGAGRVGDRCGSTQS
jgi:hypothetical protein